MLVASLIFCLSGCFFREPGQTGGGTGMQYDSAFFLFLFSTRNYAKLVLFGIFFVSMVLHWQFKLLDYHVGSFAGT